MQSVCNSPPSLPATCTTYSLTSKTPKSLIDSQHQWRSSGQHKAPQIWLLLLYELTICNTVWTKLCFPYPPTVVRQRHDIHDCHYHGQKERAASIEQPLVLNELRTIKHELPGASFPRIGPFLYQLRSATLAWPSVNCFLFMTFFNRFLGENWKLCLLRNFLSPFPAFINLCSQRP